MLYKWSCSLASMFVGLVHVYIFDRVILPSYLVLVGACQWRKRFVFRPVVGGNGAKSKGFMVVFTM